jgi:hypothetical protein
MRILLLQPEDSPGVGPWSRERWDLIVDLGKSSQFSAETWERQSGCPVLRSDSFRDGTADVRQVRSLFSAARRRLIDEEGIDWWDLTSLLVAQEALTVLALRRLAVEIGTSAELWATRSGGPARLLEILLERTVHTFDDKGLARAVARSLGYAGLARRFSAEQIKEIVLDKYDPGYRWRSRFATPRQPCAESVVLVPSAYGNVSRMAAAYARLLPQQAFLLVATRHSGKQFVSQPNVQVRDLAAYGKAGPSESDSSKSEIRLLLQRWAKLRTEICSSPDLQVLSRAGVLDPISDWMRDGLSIRDAWRAVLEKEPVRGVLCGDDSNRYTLLPVLLAARRKIPTVDFHHGAFDGRYLLKELPCDVYLAKNEMERDYLLRVCELPTEKIVIGAPAPRPAPSSGGGQSQKSSVVFFSEPYEVVGMRAAEVYRELLPPLCRLARANGRGVVIKLHPFESRSQRQRVVREILSPEDGKLVTVVDGPLTDELLSRAWFGITVESTTVVDCRQAGIQCFLCGWLTLWPFDYVQQFARFVVGEVLQSVGQIEGIPAQLEEFRKRVAEPASSPAADPVLLQEWLTSGLRERAGVRPVS